MFWSISKKSFVGNETLYSDCGHRHRSQAAAERCLKNQRNRAPKPGETISFIEMRLSLGGAS